MFEELSLLTLKLNEREKKVSGIRLFAVHEGPQTYTS
jgi:hypothetical protein